MLPCGTVPYGEGFASVGYGTCTCAFVQVEKVKKECLPGTSGLDCPLLEEYDFAHDTVRLTHWIVTSV
jgi:hypothetical protein